LTEVKNTHEQFGLWAKIRVIRVKPDLIVVLGSEWGQVLNYNILLWKGIIQDSIIARKAPQKTCPGFLS